MIFPQLIWAVVYFQANSLNGKETRTGNWKTLNEFSHPSCYTCMSFSMENISQWCLQTVQPVRSLQYWHLGLHQHIHQSSTLLIIQKEKAWGVAALGYFSGYTSLHRRARPLRWQQNSEICVCPLSSLSVWGTVVGNALPKAFRKQEK